MRRHGVERMRGGVDDEGTWGGEGWRMGRHGVERMRGGVEDGEAWGGEDEGRGGGLGDMGWGGGWGGGGRHGVERRHVERIMGYRCIIQTLPSMFIVLKCD